MPYPLGAVAIEAAGGGGPDACAAAIAFCAGFLGAALFATGGALESAVFSLPTDGGGAAAGSPATAVAPARALGSLFTASGDGFGSSPALSMRMRASSAHLPLGCLVRKSL